MMVNEDGPNIPAVGRGLPDGGSDHSGVVARRSACSVPPSLGLLAALPERWSCGSWAFTGGGRHRRPVTSWSDVAGQVLRSWPLMLSFAVLLFVVLTGTAEVVAKIGLSGPAIAMAVNAWFYGRRRSRRI